MVAAAIANIATTTAWMSDDSGPGHHAMPANQRHATNCVHTANNTAVTSGHREICGHVNLTNLPKHSHHALNIPAEKAACQPKKMPTKISGVPTSLATKLDPGTRIRPCK
jgi:hypothetical protein